MWGLPKTCVQHRVGAASAGFWSSRCCPRPHQAVLAGSKQYSAAIAFTLALFSHLINHVNIRLQAELEEGENPVPAFRSDGAGRCGRAPPHLPAPGGAFGFCWSLLCAEQNRGAFPPAKSQLVTLPKMQGWASFGQQQQQQQRLIPPCVAAGATAGRMQLAQLVLLPCRVDDLALRESRGGGGRSRCVFVSLCLKTAAQPRLQEPEGIWAA